MLFLHLFVGDLFDDTSSQSSTHSEKYSNWTYYSADEHNPAVTTPQRHAYEDMLSPSRLCPNEGSTSRNNAMARLTRNRSLVDTRSQLLHRSLVEEVNRRRLFNTVGAVENIGFQNPYQVSARGMNGTYSVKFRDDAKRQEHRARRG